MMRFHVMIKDNETGEVLLETGSNAIIAAVDAEETVRQIVHTDCDILTAALTAMGAIANVEEYIDENEKVAEFVKVIKKIAKRKKKAEARKKREDA